jgi:hypothetical protein
MVFQDEFTFIHGMSYKLLFQPWIQLGEYINFHS